MSFTANTIYGKYKHKLTVSEMPSHYHNVVLKDAENDLLRIHYDSGTWGRCREPNRNCDIVNTSAIITNSQGGNSSHNNIQPSLVVFFWRRTA